jgi:coproporphyrinogen III oxidase-like Fe-S oxidoreductase
MWGCDTASLDKLGFLPYFQLSAEPFLRDGFMERNQDTYRLTPKGKFLADGIASELFRVD